MQTNDCQACLPRKKRDFMATMDAFQEYLLRGTYILGSCLIIFSLMMFNGLLSANSKIPGDNFIRASAPSLSLAVRNMWYDTAVAAEAVGEHFDALCLGTWRNSIQGLGRIFAVTGNILAGVPEVLTSPPYAYARSR